METVKNGQDAQTQGCRKPTHAQAYARTKNFDLKRYSPSCKVEQKKILKPPVVSRLMNSLHLFLPV